jgi:hypothetical protein
VDKGFVDGAGSLNEGHGFTAWRKTHISEGYGVPRRSEHQASEGYGLQAVRKCFAMNPALAAEGRFPLACPGMPWEAALFPQAV